MKRWLILIVTVAIRKFRKGGSNAIEERLVNEMECSICGDEIEMNVFGCAISHNAEPVNADRCCDRCNMQVVLPAKQAWMHFQGDVEKFDLWCKQWIEKVLTV